MSDETTATESPQTTGQTPAEAKTSAPGPIPYDRFQEVTAANAELKKRLAALENDEKKRTEEAKRNEEKRLADQQEWQKLADARAAELAAIAPKAELADKLLARIDAANKARIEKLPTELQTLVPSAYGVIELSEWLDANLEKLITPKPVNLDGGRAGDRNVSPVVEKPRVRL